jgi:taurine transport system permease protein
MRDSMKNLEYKNKIAIVSVAGFLIIWTMVVELGFVQRLFLPSPLDVLKAIPSIGIFSLIVHTLSTTARTIVGFTLGSIIGIAIGLAGRYNETFGALVFPHINAWRPVPPVALVPFFILWFGFSEVGKTILVTLGCAIILAVETRYAIDNIEQRYIQAAATLGADKHRIYRTIMLPAITPLLLGPLKIALALAITLVIVSEFMGADYGLGYLLNVAKVTRSLSVILLVTVLLGVIGFLLDRKLEVFLKAKCEWNKNINKEINKDVTL